MDRNRGRVFHLDAMATAGEGQVVVRRFVGRCPIGGCSREGCDLGKGYEDGGADARKKVWNHLRYSSSHEGVFGADEEVSEYLDREEEHWLKISEQIWQQEEFDQYIAETAEPQPDIPEPEGAPPMVKPKSKGKGKDKAKGEGKGKGKDKDLSKLLEWQLKKQTENMYYFSRAAGTCISALKVASEMCRQAADTFDRQKNGMEEGMEAMIEAFGIDPPKTRRGRGSLSELSSGSSANLSLAREVRRGSPY